MSWFRAVWKSNFRSPTRLLDGVGVHEGPNAGSEYKRDGSVARGPAPKPLKLAKVGIDEQGQVVLEKWTEQDFRENV